MSGSDEFCIDSTGDPATCSHDSVNGGCCGSCGSWIVETDDGPMIDVLKGTPWVSPTQTEPGTCRCGGPLPVRSAWHNPFSQWSHVICPGCGWEFVDEDDYLAVYDTAALERLGQTDEDHEGCQILTDEQVAKQVQWHRDHPFPPPSDHQERST